MTRLQGYMKLGWVILAAISLAACGTNKEPTIAPSVQPAIARIEAPIVEASAISGKIKGYLDVAAKELAARKADAQAFQVQLDSYKAQGKSAQEQLDITWAELNKQYARNLFLEGEIGKASTQIDELENSLDYSRAAIANAVEVAQQQDKNAIAQSQVITGLRRDLAKAEKTAANAKVYKFWIIVAGASMAVLWLAREIIPRIIRGGI